MHYDVKIIHFNKILLNQGNVATSILHSFIIKRGCRMILWNTENKFKKLKFYWNTKSAEKEGRLIKIFSFLLNDPEVNKQCKHIELEKKILKH